MPPTLVQSGTGRTPGLQSTGLKAPCANFFAARQPALISMPWVKSAASVVVLAAVFTFGMKSVLRWIAGS
jgi:hypothetical protein